MYVIYYVLCCVTNQIAQNIRKAHVHNTVVSLYFLFLATFLEKLEKYLEKSIKLHYCAEGEL